MKLTDLSDVCFELQSKPTNVGHAPPVTNARSFRPGEDSDDDASDVGNY